MSVPWVPLAVLMAVLVLLRIPAVRRLLVVLSGGDRVPSAVNQALARQVDAVSLRPGVVQWADAAAIDALCQPLLAAGYAEAGDFIVSPLDVKLRILAKPEDAVVGHVYEHPRAGVWIELVTRYQDGSTFSLTTLPPTGLQSPPWTTTLRAGKQRSDLLAARLLRERKAGAVRPVSREEARRSFEDGYARAMAWQKSRQVTKTELAKIAVRPPPGAR